MKVCEVVQPGPLSMVQDLGRRGHYTEGIPDGGAFDGLAFRLGNLVLGNPPGAAGIEILLGGLGIKFIKKTRVAITGGDLTARIDHQPAPMWQALMVEPGQNLFFGGRKSGLRAYLLFAGGLDVPCFLESRSTYPFLSKGGFKGRKLESGDILETFPIPAEASLRRIPDELRPSYGPPWVFRIVYGLQSDFFLEESFQLFESAAWSVHHQSNRMAVRLEGPVLKFKEPAGSRLYRLGGGDPSNIPTEGNPLGSIQCPAGPELIVIGPDGPCEGGYAKIGTLISADFFLLGQIKPGDRVWFKSVSLEEAYRELHRQKLIYEGKLEETARDIP
jgi:biotin-dependent carboxylase-like uncharacterized protein